MTAIAAAGAFRCWPGLMLPFRALTEGRRNCGRRRCLAEAIAAQADREGWSSLHADLAQLDPETAARIR